jgi:hypothetical protein
MPASYVEAETSLQEIEGKLKGLFEKKENILKEISHLQALVEKKPVYVPVPYPAEFTFIHAEVGEISPDMSGVLENLLGGIPHIIIPGEIRNHRLIVGIMILKKDIAMFEKVKKEINWAPLSSDISLTDVPIEKYRKKIEELKSELMIIDSQIQEIVRIHAEVLSKISLSVEMYEKLKQTKKHIVVTDMTMGLSGWIPEKDIIGKAFAIWWPPHRIKDFTGFSKKWYGKTFIYGIPFLLCLIILYLITFQPKKVRSNTGNEQ